ncbi:hypothetical protein [Methanoculleus chikugoensis]|uniref:hypothetical protein n=1 Tax=Methanoculleus chikugoensis TaxID=118126 RepID=UPI001FB46AC1|nr:hypothetical protein [Methanoculleus chikugoensis]
MTERTLPPRIERETGHAFRSPDGLARVLMAPSTKRLFSEILAGFPPEDALPIRANDLSMLGNFADDAHALALIGDVTLRLKVLSGEGVAGLAALSDRWDLHESRIGSGLRCPPDGENLEQEKETLARAVLGLIYVEGGVPMRCGRWCRSSPTIGSDRIGQRLYTRLPPHPGAGDSSMDIRAFRDFIRLGRFPPSSSRALSRSPPGRSSRLSSGARFTPPAQFLVGYAAMAAAHLSVHYSNDYFDADADRFVETTPISGGGAASSPPIPA